MGPFAWSGDSHNEFWRFISILMKSRRERTIKHFFFARKKTFLRSLRTFLNIEAWWHQWRQVENKSTDRCLYGKKLYEYTMEGNWHFFHDFPLSTFDKYFKNSNLYSDYETPTIPPSPKKVEDILTHDLGA